MGMPPSESGYGIVIAGKFEQPTVIGEIVILTSHWKQRTDGTNYFASVDGIDWVLLYQFRHDSGEGAITTANAGKKKDCKSAAGISAMSLAVCAAAITVFKKRRAD